MANTAQLLFNIACDVIRPPKLTESEKATKQHVNYIISQARTRAEQGHFNMYRGCNLVDETVLAQLRDEHKFTLTLDIPNNRWEISWSVLP